MRWIKHRRKHKLGLVAFCNDLGDAFSDEVKKAIYSFLVKLENEVEEEILTTPELIANAFEFYESKEDLVSAYPGLGNFEEIERNYAVIPLSKGFIIYV